VGLDTLGTRIEIAVRNQAAAAQIVPVPFYKRAR
jgi:hypothetical protein